MSSSSAYRQKVSSSMLAGVDNYDIDDDFDDFSNDEDDAYIGLTTSLRSIKKSTIKYLNYSNTYVQNWGCKEAFRESYQNWRDGILRSFRLSRAEFQVEFTERKRLISMTVKNPTTSNLIGFIRFQYDKDGFCVGGLKMANFNASLTYDALGTGGTSKALDAGQTGQHGEGMKLSALVFRRENLNFRIESSGFKWNFIFKKGELACRLGRISEKTLNTMKLKARGQPRTEVAHPWEDVCVVIGGPGQARTIDEDKVLTDRIHVDDFKEWLKVTLDIDPPKKMIRTAHGDLVLDGAYQGHMYLHGLLLPSGGVSGKDYAYGYNFISGKTTRDRDTLAGSGAESKKIARIWASAMQQDDSEDAAITTEYTVLLLNSLNKKGDTMLTYDSNCLDEETADKVWKKMRTMNRDGKKRPAFYYSAIEGKDDVQIIEQSLNQNPVPLDQETWKMLSKYNLCRTPNEELQHRFQSACVIEVPNTVFATHVDRMLRSLLQSSPITKDMKLTFVNGESLQVDVGFFGETWRLHDKWLTYEGAHENAYCDVTDVKEDELFACDHAVLQLWDIMISHLKSTGEHTRINTKEGWLKSMARSRLSEMPRAVKCYPLFHKTYLNVTWRSVASNLHSDSAINVTLHTEDCVNSPTMEHQNILHMAIENERVCQCPNEVSKAVSLGVYFRNLDPSVAYVPSVCRNIDGAFIALHPDPVKPPTGDRYRDPGPYTPTVLTDSPTQPDDGPDIVSDDENENGNGPDFVDSSPPRSTIYKSPKKRTSGRGSSPSIAHNQDSAMDDVEMGEGTIPRSIARGISGAQQTFEGDGMPGAVNRNAQSHELAESPKESYFLGQQIQHRSLDWGGSFPGSHDFYRARDAPEYNTFILLPKPQTTNEHGKRAREPERGSRSVRFKSLQPRCEDGRDDSEDA